RTEPELGPGTEVHDADAPHGGVRVRASLPASSERSRTATLISTLVHLILIAVLVRVTAEVVHPTRSPIGDAFQLAIGGGGGGGKGGAAFAAPPPPPPVEQALPPPVVVPTIVPPPLTPVAPETAFRDTTPTASAVAAAGRGGGSGGGTGTGTGPGTGSGVGPGSGSGTGGGNGSGGKGGTEPVGRQMVLPAPDPPKSLRGKEIEVTFSIDAAGNVVALHIRPEISDRAYGKKFEDLMRAYTFVPARDSLGRAVAATTVITVTVN
ncbi:MAG: hypothetical protein ABJC19_10020, partial [Gemmatimonadota bacterium]